MRKTQPSRNNPEPAPSRFIHVKELLSHVTALTAVAGLTLVVRSLGDTFLDNHTRAEAVVTIFNKGLLWVVSAYIMISISVRMLIDAVRALKREFRNSDSTNKDAADK